jgi:hypothetical protein
MTPLDATRRVTQSWPPRSAASVVSRSGGPASAVATRVVVNRCAGVARPSDWCGRSVLYSATQAAITCWAWALESNTVWLSSSRRAVPWNLSILPVVVGDLGAVSRWVIPFSRQIRSKSTSTGREA